MKTCSRCKEVLALSEFNKHSSRKDGLQSFCRNCSHKKFQEYYQNNRARQRLVVTKRKREVISENRNRVMDLLQKSLCIDCGERDPLVLEFDHVRGRKSNCVGTLILRGCSWGTVQKEIDKCDVRCANCHRRKTAKDFGHWRAVL